MRNNDNSNVNRRLQQESKETISEEKIPASSTGALPLKSSYSLLSLGDESIVRVRTQLKGLQEQIETSKRTGKRLDKRVVLSHLRSVIENIEENQHNEANFETSPTIAVHRHNSYKKDKEEQQHSLPPNIFVGRKERGNSDITEIDVHSPTGNNYNLKIVVDDIPKDDDAGVERVDEADQRTNTSNEVDDNVSRTSFEINRDGKVVDTASLCASVIDDSFTSSNDCVFDESIEMTFADSLLVTSQMEENTFKSTTSLDADVDRPPSPIRPPSPDRESSPPPSPTTKRETTSSKRSGLPPPSPKRTGLPPPSPKRRSRAKKTATTSPSGKAANRSRSRSGILKVNLNKNTAGEKKVPASDGSRQGVTSKRSVSKFSTKSKSTPLKQRSIDVVPRTREAGGAVGDSFETLETCMSNESEHSPEMDTDSVPKSQGNNQISTPLQNEPKVRSCIPSKSGLRKGKRLIFKRFGKKKQQSDDKNNNDKTNNDKKDTDSISDSVTTSETSQTSISNTSSAPQIIIPSMSTSTSSYKASSGKNIRRASAPIPTTSSNNVRQAFSFRNMIQNENEKAAKESCDNEEISLKDCLVIESLTEEGVDLDPVIAESCVEERQNGKKQRVRYIITLKKNSPLEPTKDILEGRIVKYDPGEARFSHVLEDFLFEMDSAVDTTALCGAEYDEQSLALTDVEEDSDEFDDEDTDDDDDNDENGNTIDEEDHDEVDDDEEDQDYGEGEEEDDDDESYDDADDDDYYEDGSTFIDETLATLDDGDTLDDHETLDTSFGFRAYQNEFSLR